MMGNAHIPDHVPDRLVRDFDYKHEMHGGDLYAWWAQAHEHPPVFYTPRNGGHWVLTRHADIARVLSDYHDFSSSTQTVPKPDKAIPLAPIEYDPPIHTDYRKLLTPFFTPKAMKELEAKAHALTIELIDGFLAKGQCEFVSEYAMIMPIGIFMSMVDLPATDRVALLDIAERIVRGTPAQQGAAFAEAFEYLDVKFTERRANLGDDALSALIKGEVDGGRPLGNAELLGMGALLLAGGLDTVAGMMSFIAVHLSEHDEDRRRLVDDPKLINSALEELLRKHQIANIAREVVNDMTFDGVEMKAGDRILTATSFAGIDENEYPDAMKVDFDRARKRSLVFGNGPHQCVGQFLARVELRVFLTEWLKRIPDFKIKPGTQPLFISGSANSVQSLHLVWPTPAIADPGIADVEVLANGR